MRHASDRRKNYKQRERAELEQQLAHVEARIDELRPLPEKYVSASRSADTEALIAPVFDRVFNVTSGIERSYRVECHGQVCKLDTNASSDRTEWRDRLRTMIPEGTMVRQIAFVHGVIFFEVVKLQELATQYIGGIHAAFWSAPETGACVTTHQARGDLLLDLQFISSSRTFSVTARGTLATHPVGACLKSVLESITQRMYVPPQVQSFPAVPVHIELPLSASPP